MHQNNQNSSELRCDPISQDWVVIAKNRSQRPKLFSPDKKLSAKSNVNNCPFCDLAKTEPILVFNHGQEVFSEKFGQTIPKQWTVAVVKNKFPAFSLQSEVAISEEVVNGVFKKMPAVGFHEVVVFKNHQKSFNQLTVEQTKEILDIYQKRFLDLKAQPMANYVAIFHNQGQSAGASIPHPHSQIITTPIIDNDTQNTLLRAKKFYQANKSCIFCNAQGAEKRVGDRVIFENDDFLAFCPFASKMAFEITIAPKKHQPYFEMITEKEKIDLAQTLKTVLTKLSRALKNPDYNFYIKTAPSDNQEYPYYHWHLTIIPRVSIWAGFELGMEMEICSYAPEQSAAILRKQKI